MNPALMALYLDKSGNFNPQGYMDQYYRAMGIEPPTANAGTPNGAADMSWLDNYKDLPVPGTGGAVSAPQLPKPQPPQPNYITQDADNEQQQEQLTPEEEYAKYGTIHGITPDPNSNYDMAPTSAAPPGSEGNPIQRGAQAAQQTARESYGIDDEQRKRALGLGIVKFFSNYAASQNPSRLGALNESFNPAIDAFITERTRYENAAAKRREQELDEEYKRGMLAVHRGELEVKKIKGPGGGLTDYQYQNLKNGFLDRASKIDEQEQSAIERATKNLRPTKAKHEEIRKQKTAEIKKKYDQKRKRLSKNAQEFGIDLGLDDDVDEEEAETIASGATPNIDVASIPKLPDGSYDTSKLTDEQKAFILKQK